MAIDNIYFTQQEIKEMYGWEQKNTPRFIEYAELRGVKLEEQSFSKRPRYYSIIDDTLAKYKWYDSIDPELEVCKEGYVRNKAKKNIYKKCISWHGYCQYRINGKLKLVHRLILMTFNPVEGMEDLIVDHINGKRTDNRLENLRWVTQKQNTKYKIKNWTDIQQVCEELIKKYGYEETFQKLKSLL